MLAAVLSTHGPSFLYVLSAVLIPSALVVPLITGFAVGDDRSGFASFVVLQVGYYAIVARAATYLGRAPSAPVG